MEMQRQRELLRHIESTDAAETIRAERDVRPARVCPTYDVVEETVRADTRFLSAKTEQLYRWWASASNGQPPRRSDFDILDHWTIAPDVFLVEVLPDGDFLFKLSGERVIDLIGVNNRGCFVSRDETLGDYGHSLSRYYRSIVEARVCKKCSGDFEYRNRKHIRFESIDCPLVDDDGTVVALIGAMEQLEPA